MALNMAIVVGLMLILGALLASGWQAWRAEPAAVFSAIMLAVGVRLFTGSSDYGLFKLAMYIQPFLISSVVLAWFQMSLGLARITVNRRLLIRYFPIVLIVALSLRTQSFYVNGSSGSGGSGLAEVPHASENRLLDELANLRSKAHRRVLISDTHNAEMAKVETLYLNPASLQFPAADFFEPHLS